MKTHNLKIALAALTMLANTAYADAAGGGGSPAIAVGAAGAAIAASPATSNQRDATHDAAVIGIARHFNGEASVKEIPLNPKKDAQNCPKKILHVSYAGQDYFIYDSNNAGQYQIVANDALKKFFTSCTGLAANKSDSAEYEIPYAADGRIYTLKRGGGLELRRN